MARMMKHIYAKDILPYFRTVISQLKIIQNNGGSEYVYAIMSYLIEASEIQNKEEFINTVKTGLTIKEEKIMTLAEQFREEDLKQSNHKRAVISIGYKSLIHYSR